MQISKKYEIWCDDSLDPWKLVNNQGHLRFDPNDQKMEVTVGQHWSTIGQYCQNTYTQKQFPMIYEHAIKFCENCNLCLMKAVLPISWN